MKLEEAIKKSIKQYFEMDNEEDEELFKLGESKYTKKYFDSFEEEILGGRGKEKTLKAKIKDVDKVKNSKDI